MNNLIVTSLDLELNKSGNKTTSIIQIGAIVGNLSTGEILERVNLIVNPQEPLDPFIIKLTGITQEQVDSGIPLKEAYSILSNVHTKHGSLRNCVTWGGGDNQELRSQLGLNEQNFIFGRRWIDVKTIYQSYRMSQDMKIQAGLKKACHNMGLLFKGPAHDALQDAENTFNLYIHLLKKFTK
jgi:inhibitor of KinA sporulation pathway (predicted exonuclease)